MGILYEYMRVSFNKLAHVFNFASASSHEAKNAGQFSELAHVFNFASAKIKKISEKKKELKLNYHNR